MTPNPSRSRKTVLARLLRRSGQPEPTPPQHAVVAHLPSPSPPPPVGCAPPPPLVLSHPIVSTLAELASSVAPLSQRAAAAAQPTRLRRAPLAAAKPLAVKVEAKATTTPPSAPHIHPAVRVLVAKALITASAAALKGKPSTDDAPATTQVHCLVARALSRVAAAELGDALGPPHVCRVARDKLAALAGKAVVGREGAPPGTPGHCAATPPNTASLEATLSPPRLSRLQREAAEWAAVPRRPAKWVR